MKPVIVVITVPSFLEARPRNVNLTPKGKAWVKDHPRPRTIRVQVPCPHPPACSHCAGYWLTPGGEDALERDEAERPDTAPQGRAMEVRQLQMRRRAAQLAGQQAAAESRRA